MPRGRVIWSSLRRHEFNIADALRVLNGIGHDLAVMIAGRNFDGSFCFGMSRFADSK